MIVGLSLTPLALKQTAFMSVLDYNTIVINIHANLFKSFE